MTMWVFQDSWKSGVDDACDWSVINRYKIYAKNYCNRIPIVKVIVENVVTCFLGHSVDRKGRMS